MPEVAQGDRGTGIDQIPRILLGSAMVFDKSRGWFEVCYSLE